MKIQVRQGLFETNSSSVHSITMCMENDYEKWKNGELIFDRDAHELVPLTDKNYLEWKKDYDESIEKYGEYDDYYVFLTYDQFFDDWEVQEYETFKDSFKSASGDNVVAFGFYGHD